LSFTVAQTSKLRALFSNPFDGSQYALASLKVQPARVAGLFGVTKI